MIKVRRRERSCMRIRYVAPLAAVRVVLELSVLVVGDLRAEEVDDEGMGRGFYERFYSGRFPVVD